jgi:uncharacterized protein YkwD
MSLLSLVAAMTLTGTKSHAQNTLSKNLKFLNFSSDDGGQQIEENDKGLLDIALDQSGNIYGVGFFRKGLKMNGNNYSCGSKAAGTTYFFGKFNQTGQLQWIKQFDSPVKGGGYINAEKIEIDGAGNIYVFGVHKGKQDMDLSNGTFYIENESAVDFLGKYDMTGQLIWAKSYSSGFYGGTRDFTVDSKGNSYLISYPANVAKISPEGEEIYRTYLPNGNSPGSICLKGDKLYVGTSISGDYEISLKFKDGKTKTYPAIKKDKDHFYNTEALIACLSAQDGQMLWANVIRSSQSEEISSIGVDGNHNVTVIGSCSAQAKFGRDQTRKLSKTHGNRNQAFIAQYSSTGLLNWFQSLESVDQKNGGNYGESLQVDQTNGHIYSTRAHCSEGLWWAVYFDQFTSSGKKLDTHTFGIRDGKNNGFFKSSCGSANFFVHLNNRHNSFFLFGEGRSYVLDPKDFGSTRDKPTYNSDTEFFLAKYQLGEGSVNNWENDPDNLSTVDGNGSDSENTPDIEAWSNTPDNATNSSKWTDNDYKTYSTQQFLKLPQIQNKVNADNLDQELLDACIYYLTNEKRTKNNRAPFKHSSSLRKSSDMHSEDMARDNFYSHINSKDGSKRDPGVRMARFGVGQGPMAENIAKVPYNGLSYLELAKEFVDMWMASPGHRKNILSKDFRYLGCGIALRKSSGTAFGTQNFSGNR